MAAPSFRARLAGSGASKKIQPGELGFVTAKGKDLFWCDASLAISQVIQRRIPTGTVIKKEFYGLDCAGFLILIYSV